MTGNVFDYSTTPGSNTGIAGINIAPGCPSSSVGPALRQHLADIAEGVAHSSVAGGTADALTVVFANIPTALTDGMEVKARAASANATAAPTLNVNSLGAKTITKLGGSALVAGDIAGALHEIILRYNLANTRWELLNPAGVGTLPAGSIWSTGDVKLTLKTAADAGWVLMNDGTIGDASSGGTARANADTAALFTLLWTNTANAQCPVSSGRGASAALDFAAHKTIGLPLALGRALAVAGAGSGLTSRVLALATGAETVAIAQANLPNVNFTVTDPGHSHFMDGATGGGGAVNPTMSTGANANVSSDKSATTGISVNSGGSGTGVAIMQPTGFLNIMVKL